jgi:hypothetical protein
MVMEKSVVNFECGCTRNSRREVDRKKQKTHNNKKEKPVHIRELRLSHSFVCRLHNLQFAVYMAFERFNAGIGRVFGAVQHKGEAFNNALMFAIALETRNQTPFAARIFSPRVCGHKRPVGEAILAVVIFWPTRKNHRACARGRHQIESGITPASAVECDDGLNVFQVLDFRGRAHTCVRFDFHHEISMGWYFMWSVDGASLAMETRWCRLPHHCQGDHLSGIEDAEAEQMIVFQSDAIHLPFEVSAIAGGLCVFVVVLHAQLRQFPATTVEEGVAR